MENIQQSAFEHPLSNSERFDWCLQNINRYFERGKFFLAGSILSYTSIGRAPTLTKSASDRERDRCKET